MDKIDKKLLGQIILLDSIEKLRKIEKNIKLTGNAGLLKDLKKFLIILRQEEAKQDIDLFNISMGKMILSQNNFSLKYYSPNVNTHKIPHHLIL